MRRPVLSVGAWKVLLSIVALFVATLFAAELWYAPRTLAPGAAGTLGMSYHELPQWGRSRYVIDSLAPDSPMRAVGAQVGDVWIPDRFYDASRRLESREAIGLTLVQNGAPRHVTVETRPLATPPAVGTYVLTWLVSLLGLATGVLVGIRRPDSRALRGFSLWFLLSTTFYAFQSYRILPAGAFYLAYQLCWPVGRALAGACILIFVFNYPDDNPRSTPLKRWLLRYPVLLLSALYAATYAVMTLHAAGYYAPLSGPVIAVGFGVWLAFVLAIMWDNWRTSRGELRDRHLWVLISFAVLVSMQPFVAVIFSAQSSHVSQSSLLPAIVRSVGLLSFVIFVYAILRHRIVSLGFAVNRAMVYGAASIGMLLSFGLLEWAAHHLLEFTGREKSVWLDAVIALGIFLVFHRLRNAGENLIERLFFHAWHLKEEALRKFVREAPFVTRPEALLAAFTAALDRFTEGAGYALYRHAQTGDYERITATLADAPQRVDADEPLAVALRANPLPTHCLDAGSNLPGDLALPSVHHGQLDGFVVLGPKLNGDTYRPDEIEALGYAAHQVGLDFRALRMEQLEREAAERARRDRDYEAIYNLVEQAIERGRNRASGNSVLDVRSVPGS